MSNRPFVIFERTINKGQSEKKSKDGKVLLAQGEHKQEWKKFLADEGGELYSFATELGIRHYLKKGWKPIEIGGFNEWLKRKNPEDERVQGMVTIRTMLSELIDSAAELSEKNFIIEQQEAEIRALRELADKQGLKLPKELTAPPVAPSEVAEENKPSVQEESSQDISSASPADQYSKLKVVDLHMLIEERGLEEMPSNARKDELIAALLEDDSSKGADGKAKAEKA